MSRNKANHREWLQLMGLNRPQMDMPGLVHLQQEQHLEDGSMWVENSQGSCVSQARTGGNASLHPRVNNSY